MKGRSPAQEGFISTGFLIVMCVMMSLIAIKSDYIIKADQVYKNLIEDEECFYYEAHVIDVFKCMLARKEEIDDFFFDGIRVNVYQSGEGYDLYYLQYRLSLSVYEDRIVDFVLQHS